MSKLRIGVLSPADISSRRMIPAFIASDRCEYVGVAVATPEERVRAFQSIMKNNDYDPPRDSYERGRQKALAIKDEFGGRVFNGFMSMIESDDVDAVYIALPPYLHATWGKEVLRAGKHLLMEKPFTVSLEETYELVDMARDSGLAVIENFGFVYHPQMDKIREIIGSGTIGEVRLIRSNFGFPHRGEGDFRYKKELGGGAVLDCGCYTLKLASLLLGNDMEITGHELFAQDDGLDISGTVTAIGRSGVPAQLSFGMDQQYCCNLEVWGSEGCITSNRIYTAPAGYEMELSVTRGMDTEKIRVEGTDQFRLVAEQLVHLTEDADARTVLYNEILMQSELVESVKDGGRMR